MDGLVDAVRHCSALILIPQGGSCWAEGCLQSSNPIRCVEHSSGMWRCVVNTKWFLYHSRFLTNLVLGFRTGGSRSMLSYGSG